jgi:hypothetical protein
MLEEKSGIFDTIKKHSVDADFVFLGLRPPAPEETIEEYSQYYKNIIQQTRIIPPMAYVLSSEDIDFQKIFSSI